MGLRNCLLSPFVVMSLGEDMSGNLFEIEKRRRRRPGVSRPVVRFTTHHSSSIRVRTRFPRRVRYPLSWYVTSNTVLTGAVV